MHCRYPGASLRNIFHIGHEYEVFDRDFCTPGTEILLDTRFDDVAPVPPNKLMSVDTTDIRIKKTGKLAYRSKDYTMCMNVSAGDIEAIRKKGWGKDPLVFMKNGFRRRPAKFPEPQENEISYLCDNDLALRFGLTSGAINITHGVWLISRYFKRGNPFLQGTCTANLVILLLTLYRRETFNKFKIYFNNMLYLPNRVVLRTDDHDFELFDEKGTMVSFGSRE